MIDMSGNFDPTQNSCANVCALKSVFSFWKGWNNAPSRATLLMQNIPNRHHNGSELFHFAKIYGFAAHQVFSLCNFKIYSVSNFPG